MQKERRKLSCLGRLAHLVQGVLRAAVVGVVVAQAEVVVTRLLTHPSRVRHKGWSGII